MKEIKTFKDLIQGQKFTVDGVSYIKTDYILTYWNSRINAVSEEYGDFLYFKDEEPVEPVVEKIALDVFGLKNPVWLTGPDVGKELTDEEYDDILKEGE